MDEKYTKVAGAGLALVILLQVPGIYSNLLPTPCEISKEDPSSAYSRKIRQSEMYATAVALGLGFAGSLITSSPWPFFGVLLMAGALVFHYENSIRYMTPQ